MFHLPLSGDLTLPQTLFFRSDRSGNHRLLRSFDFSDPQRVQYLDMILKWGNWNLFQELLAVLRSIGDRHSGVSIANVATRWVLDQPAVGAVIIGESPDPIAPTSRRPLISRSLITIISTHLPSPLAVHPAMIYITPWAPSTRSSD